MISRPRGILASSLAGGGGGRDVRVEVVRVSMEPSSKRPPVGDSVGYGQWVAAEVVLHHQTRQGANAGGGSHTELTMKWSRMKKSSR